ncbi:MAG: hypothetical protein HRT74_06580, partial [Flavobacteriales bacterium]|nr:hypothetical protein [Flavobacteriales bacterium]
MKTTLTLLFSLFAFMGFSQLTQIVCETYVGNNPEAQPEGTTTYRLYAELQDSDDVLTAVSGFLNCEPLSFSTTTTFFNSEFGSHIGANINPGFFGLIPEVEYDSWVTLGSESNQSFPGTTVTDIYTDVTASAEEVFGLNPSQTNMLADDGSIFSTPNSENTMGVGPSNRVLLGQFTTSGIFSWSICVQVLDGGVGGTSTVYMNTADSGCTSGINTINGIPFGVIGSFGTNSLCDDETACNYTPDALPDYIDNSVCEYESCLGCTDPGSCHFDPTATVDDGSCDDVCPGCTDPSADNYAAQAEEADGS